MAGVFILGIQQVSKLDAWLDLQLLARIEVDSSRILTNWFSASNIGVRPTAASLSLKNEKSDLWTYFNSMD